MPDLTPAQQQFLKRMLNCDIRSQRMATHFILAFGVLLSIGMMIYGIVAPRGLYVFSAPFGLALPILLSVGRYKFLQTFEIVQKLYGNARDFDAAEP
jgi:hypothetical protein